MPVIVFRKNSLTGESAALTNADKQLLAFKDKNAAKIYLANQGIYCMVGYSFPEVEIKPEEEAADAAAEPTA